MLINSLIKKIAKTFFLIIFISLSLTSCTPRLWLSKGQTVAQVGSFFIDKENNRIVLLGENIKGFKYENDNYAIQDKTEDKRLIKAFEIAEKSKNPVMNILNSSAKGEDLYGWLWIAFKIGDNLTQQEKSFLKLNNKSPKFNEGFFGYGFQVTNNDLKFPITKATRYLSSKEKHFNFCSELNKTNSNDLNCVKITKFESPNQITISEKDTASETAIKVIKTPFTVIADIVLIPYYFISLWIHATNHN